MPESPSVQRPFAQTVWKLCESESLQGGITVKKENCFEIIYTEGSSLTTVAAVILVDKETGVHYLFTKSGYSGGLTPLLDAEGKPVVKKEV